MECGKEWTPHDGDTFVYMNVLITGITGFVGSHLVDYILREHPDVEIVGISASKIILS